MTLVDAPRFGTGIGLHRVEYLLSELGVDRAWLSKAAIAITGSNGKGSTALMCDEIARAHGFRSGLFTSPHLYRFEERIKLNGENIPSQALEASLARVVSASTRYTEAYPGQVFAAFELLFAAAVELFSREGCEVCVFEAGIGGRYDPVRLVRSSVAAVTSVELEHTALLGSTLELICLDKIDICTAGGTVYLGESCLPLVASVSTYCALRDVTPVQLGREVSLLDIEVGTGGTRFKLQLPDGNVAPFVTSLLGPHQANNAALAVLLFRSWLEQWRSDKPFSTAAAQAGLERASWPGRLEVVSRSPLVIIDVGHTPDGVRVALEGLQQAYSGHRFVLVIGVSIDKEAASIVEQLAPSFDAIVCTQAYYKGRPAEEMKGIVESRGEGQSISVAESIETAVEAALEIAERERCGVYVAGSMYAAVEFAESLRGRDPRAIPHL